ncbi:hypothetical protein [Nioella sp.]|uniref:hypothetical protein n=1 Tax=Nioella sp. TaxID=1912091 RepID=UPI003B5283B0
MKDQALWERIDAHPMPKGFIDALTAQSGWTRDRAEETVREYKRLAYLVALVKTARRVPSTAVEQVWRLHGEDRSAYQSFCSEALGRDWHLPDGPVPRRGGRDMELTLKAYAREFGETAPARIWPDPNRRVRLGIAGGFAAAGAAGSVAASSVGPVLAGGALAALILWLGNRGSVEAGDHWWYLPGGDVGFDGSDGGGGDGGGGGD